MLLLPAGILAREGTRSDVIRLVGEHDVLDIRDRDGLTVAEVQDRLATMVDVNR
jgi:hypothetical protein